MKKMLVIFILLTLNTFAFLLASNAESNINQPNAQTLDHKQLAEIAGGYCGSNKTGLDYDKGSAYYKQAILQSPYWKYYWGVAKCYDNKALYASKSRNIAIKNEKLAEVNYKEAIRLIPQDETNLYEIGSLYRTLGSLYHHSRNLGFICYNAKENDLAIESYNKALEFMPNDFLTYEWLGDLYEDNKFDHKKAIEYYKKALTLTNDPSEINWVESRIKKAEKNLLPY
ncbi:MAG: hypothetical protein A2104_03935 [Candidatus Melainabacteria bacterium GWF2_32_7]|nr:MAG: hypothetical protein A2104_03935 [Candidatus Melainabacteria bacterium GWF2_32_7]